MKNFTFKRQLMFVMFMLLGNLSIYAADDDLITKQITIKLEEAGTLPNKIGYSKMYKITNLKIIGKFNNTDISFIRKMGGSDNVSSDHYVKTDGKLAILDLSEAKMDSSLYSDSRYNELYNSAFTYCSSLTSVKLPESLTSIDGYFFYGCSSLTSISIPESVTSIERFAFGGCSSLTSINIPKSVTSIENGAFYKCKSLTNIEIPAGVEISQQLFQGCSSLTSINIPEGQSEIHYYTFDGCSSLSSINIPSSVTVISNSAFKGCSSLSSINIPSSVTTIWMDAFSGCSGLKSIYVSWETPVPIGSSAFKGVDKKACTLYIPKGTYDKYWLTDWGEFENIVEYDATGIANITTSSEAKEISRYSVNGQRLDKPAKGMNIVKFSDGSVKKVVVQ